MNKIIKKILNENNYTVRFYERGDEILSPLDENNSFFIVLSGSCSVYNRGVSGEDIFVFRYEEGLHFGESELVSSKRYPLFVMADGDVEVAIFTKDEFFNLLSKNFDFTLFIMKGLADKMLNGSDMRMSLVFYTIKERFLIAIKNAYENGSLQMLTKKELAEQIDSSTRSINRTILYYSEIVVYENKRFKVVDKERLSIEVNKIICGENKK